MWFIDIVLDEVDEDALTPTETEKRGPIPVEDLIQAEETKEVHGMDDRISISSEEEAYIPRKPDQKGILSLISMATCSLFRLVSIVVNLYFFYFSGISRINVLLVYFYFFLDFQVCYTENGCFLWFFINYYVCLYEFLLFFFLQGYLHLRSYIWIFSFFTNLMYHRLQFLYVNIKFYLFLFLSVLSLIIEKTNNINFQSFVSF